MNQYIIHFKSFAAERCKVWYICCVCIGLLWCREGHGRGFHRSVQVRRHWHCYWHLRHWGECTPTYAITLNEVSIAVHGNLSQSCRMVCLPCVELVTHCTVLLAARDQNAAPPCGKKK